MNSYHVTKIFLLIHGIYEIFVFYIAHALDNGHRQWTTITY